MYITCQQCKQDFFEDDTNPNIHYSNPVTICWRCEAYNKAPKGSWFQDSKGNYYEKV